MGYEACITAIQAAAGGKLTDDQVSEILDDVIRRKRRILGETPLKGDEEARLQAAKELSEEAKIAALVEKRNRAINILRKQENLGFIKSTFDGKEARGIQALTVGTEGREAGAALSQDAQAKGILRGFLGPLVGELRQANLLPILREGAMVRGGQAIGLFKGRAAAFVQFEKDVARELWRIDDPEGIFRPSPASGNDKAVAAAKIIHKYQETARLLQNDAGAWIGKLPGYIVRQSHDQLRIAGRGREADFARWRDTIAPRLDERTFDSVDDTPAAREKFLHDVWMALSSGVHERPQGDWLGAFKGPGNLAKRMSQERVLHFKSADDWHAYNEVYGTGSLLEAVVHGFSGAARNLAALRVWGTNPEAAFTRLREELTQRALDRGDLKEAARIRGEGVKGDNLRRQFEAANGLLGVPESPTLARIGANIRAMTSMAKLGGVVLSSFPDVAVAASLLKHNGVGLLERWQAATFGSALRGPLSAEDRRVVDYLGTAIDGVLGGVVNRFASTDHFAGKVTKLQDIFFRVNLLGFWTDRLKEGVSLMLARHMAEESSKAFGALDPRHQVTLGRYGISSDAWDLIRRHVADGGDERSYLLPDVADRVTDDEIRSYLVKPDADAAAVARARFDLSTKLRSYFSEQTQDALTEPGARERAMTSMGTRPGSVAGELARSIALFKTFPITFITRQLGREWKRAETTGAGIAGIASLIAGTTVLGALSNVASDLSKGRSPRDPLALSTWNAALLKGGGLGIYGDFIFGTSNRFGQSILETAAGPELGTLSDFKRVIDAAVTGSDWKPQALRFGVNNAPFVNLFYTRMALDYLVLYQVQEMLNPGFLQRFERNVEKNNKQTFLIRPSQAIPYGGGNRILEGVR